MERDPAAVLQAAIRGVVDRLPESVKEEKADAVTFQPAKYFVGHKEGFYFGTSSNGTGYYLDELYIEPAELSKGPIKQSVDAEDLLREAEEQAGIDEVQLLDAKSLRRHVAAFERKVDSQLPQHIYSLLSPQYKDNLEMRMKYADQPEKFMESELDLDEEVQRLLAVAGSPELYPDFVKLGAVENLMALLSHENADIAADVIDLFQQLTDADVIEDSEEEAQVLVDSMIEHNGIELLVFRLTSLTESASDEEGKAVFNTLSIFENMVEVKPEVAEMVFERSKLLKWMLGRLRPREFDSNKQSTAELLAILLQNSPKNQQRLADANGIDALLQAIAPYKNRNPGSVDEEEYLENLFNSLCACLMSAETRSLFLKAEGVELMLLILKQKRLARAGALKALDFATTRSAANCERFVEQYGLRTISAMFMGKCKVKRRKGEDAEEAEEEERALSTIANLFQGLSRGSRRDRLAAKFVENEFEKCDRLMELYARYHTLQRAAEAEARRIEDNDFLDEEARLSARMDRGLYSLQQCALIVGHLWFVGDMGVRKRILQLLHQKSLTLSDIRDTLTEFLGSIGDEGDAAEAERERNRVKRMLTALGFEGPLETATTVETAKPAAAVLEDASQINGVAEHAQAQAPPVLEQGGNAIEEPVLEHERSPASLPDSDADVPRGKIEKEDKPQHRHRQEEREARHDKRDLDDEDRWKERRRKGDEERHDSRHRHREDRDRERRHRERDRDSKREKRRREDDDRRDRKRDKR